MKLDFRQGIVRYQQDGTGNPSFLSIENDGSISIVASPDPTVVTFAHGSTDYLFEESQNVPSAWTGSFQSGTDYWLYWDIDAQTGERTFGSTTLKPTYGDTAPQSPTTGKHWFDTNSAQMKVWNGAAWVVKIRLFAAKLAQGASIQYIYSLGSQVGMTTPTYAGYIIFDDNDKAVRKFDGKRAGVFLTTESPLSTQAAKLANLRIETSMPEGTANQTIPQWSAVAYTDAGEISAATYEKPQYPAVGIANEAISYGETRAFVNAGYIEDANWNWTEPVGTPIFYDDTGQLTTDVPSMGGAQQVATVVSPTSLLVNIKDTIYYG